MLIGVCKYCLQMQVEVIIYWEITKVCSSILNKLPQLGTTKHIQINIDMKTCLYFLLMLLTHIYECIIQNFERDYS